MAQNRLVNYRHLLSKRGVRCQVLQHEVSLVLRGRRGGARWGIAWTNARPCASRLSLLLLCKLWEQLSDGNPHTHLTGLKCHLLNTQHSHLVTETAQQLCESFNRQLELSLNYEHKNEQAITSDHCDWHAIIRSDRWRKTVKMSLIYITHNLEITLSTSKVIKSAICSLKSSAIYSQIKKSNQSLICCYAVSAECCLTITRCRQH